MEFGVPKIHIDNEDVEKALITYATAVLDKGVTRNLKIKSYRHSNELNFNLVKLVNPIQWPSDSDQPPDSQKIDSVEELIGRIHELTGINTDFFEVPIKALLTKCYASGYTCIYRPSLNQGLATIWIYSDQLLVLIHAKE